MKPARVRPALHAAVMAAGAAAALLAVAGLRALAFSTPAPPPGYRAAAGDGYVVYAPSPHALREGVAEVRGARATFRRRFGVAPRPLVVVLADSPAALRAIGLRRLARPGAALLPFVTRAHLAAAADADPGAQVEDRAAGRFWADGSTLGHEVCHQLVAGHADRTSRRREGSPRDYGHPALPDWFDEMAATLCESPAARARRHAYVRAALPRRIPLAELARMEHPARARMAAAGLPSSGAPVRSVTGDAARALLRGADVPLFYAQSLSLGEFLSERGGPRALRLLADQLAAGRTLDDALAAARRRVPGLPGSTAALEGEWVRWVMRRSP